MTVDGYIGDGKSNASLIYIPSAIFLILCPLLVTTRLWSRLRKGGHMGADDYTILASLVGLVLLAPCYLY